MDFAAAPSPPSAPAAFPCSEGATQKHVPAKGHGALRVISASYPLRGTGERAAGM